MQPISKNKALFSDLLACGIHYYGVGLTAVGVCAKGEREAMRPTVEQQYVSRRDDLEGRAKVAEAARIWLRLSSA